MKKTFYAFVCASIFALSLSVSASAEQYLPKSISIEASSIYNAGDTVKVSIKESSNPIKLQKNIEYGVARTVDNDGLTYFEIVTTEYVDLANISGKLDLSVVIPNILPQDATSTYVVYTKYFEKHAPDNESFYFTKSFVIVPNNNPFVKIGNVNFLQSNGSRFSTTHGPTIYTLAEASKDALLATSSSVEITFESNADTTIVPNISFTKIRSGSFKKDISLPPITIKKGKTYAVLPLPTFDYEPGVYMGQLSFTSTLLKNKVDFQYIVAGDSVSIGNIQPITKENGLDAFQIEIYGRPLDLDRLAASSTIKTPETDPYKMQVDFIDENGTVIYTTTQDVDFARNTFEVAIPKGTSKIAQVGITVSSIASGKTVFNTVRDVLYEGVIKQPLKPITYAYIIIYLLLIIIGVLAIVGKHLKTAIFCILVLVGMFISQKAFATLINMNAYRTHYANTTFTNEGISQVPTFWLQDDIVNTTYQCGESIPVVFKVYYIRCTNSAPTLTGSFSWERYITPTSGLATTVSENVNLGTINGHQFYRSYSTFIAKTMTAPLTNPASLFVAINHKGGANTTTGYSRYTVPVKTTCSVGQSVCSCTGRTQVCYQNGVAVSTTTNATACALKASCTYSISGTRATFVTLVTNGAGTLSYKDNATGKAIGQTVGKSIIGSSTVTHNVTVTDAFDKQTAIAVCSTDSVAAPSSPSGARGPATISSFYATTPVVPKGTNCEYDWDVQNVDQCSLVVTNNPNSITLVNNGTEGGPINVSTANGLNQRATITCVANGTPAQGTTPATPSVTISTTTLCQVLPEVIER